MNKSINIKGLALLTGVLLIISVAKAQDENKSVNPSAPTPVEVFFGNNRFVSQISITKKFDEKRRFGLLATSYIAADYENNLSENESMNVALISYEILKGFGLVSGAALNSHWGFRPYFGLQYFYANQKYTAMLIPGFYLTESHNFETVGFVEYRPHLKNDWSLYSRVEGLYNLDMETKKHERSFIFGRLGLSYKSFGFGFAVNYDWYGPFKVNMDNTGVFLRKAFM